MGDAIYIGKEELSHRRNKQQNKVAKLEERKALVHSTGTKGANLEGEFLLCVFATLSIT